MIIELLVLLTYLVLSQDSAPAEQDASGAVVAAAPAAPAEPRWTGTLYYI